MWNTWQFGNVGVGISASASTSALVSCSDIFWRLPGKMSSVEPFLSGLVDVPRSFTKICLEQVLCIEFARLIL